MAELDSPVPEKRHGTRRFMTRWVSLLLVGIGILILLFGLFVLLWEVPKWQVAGIAEPKDRLVAESAFRQTLVQLVGGIALLGGLYFTAQTLRTSQKTLQVNQETLRTTQQGQITERFTKAIEQLGDKDHLMIRLGGIYALERIARDSDKDHWPIMEVLTAYVRDTAPWIPKETQPLPDGQAIEVQSPETPADASSTAEGSVSRPTPTAIQAILTVIGRRTRSPNREGEYRLDLHNTDLRSAYLGGAHLEGANLRGAHLEGENLIGAHLEGADLREAHLEGAELTVAQLVTVRTLQGASLDRNLEEEIRSTATHLL